MRCLYCHEIKERTGLYDMLWSEDPLCENCRNRWKRIDLHTRLEGFPLYAPYLYNEAFSECLIRYKECMDEALAPVFVYGLEKKIRRMYRGYALVLMPSSETKKRERGFCHLAKMAEPLGMPVIDPFVKTAERPQKSLNAQERETVRDFIRLKEGALLPQKIVLFDDTVTSGATLKAALSQMDCTAHKIRIFTVSANRSKVPHKLPFIPDIAIINRPGFHR